MITIRPDTKWYTSDINEAKKAQRLAERKWRITKLEVHRQIFKEACKNVRQLIRKAKKSYYTNVIEENSHDQKSLFRTISALSGHSSDKNLPSHTSVQELTGQFSDYFVRKIDDIRVSLDATVREAHDIVRKYYNPPYLRNNKNERGHAFNDFIAFSKRHFPFQVI